MSATINAYSGQWLPPRNEVRYDLMFTNRLSNHTAEPKKPSAKPIPEGLDPIKIIVNGPATIVFWEDGTKTVVKCAKGDTWDIYNAFTAALAIKVFGSNSKIKKILKTKVEWPDDFTLAVKEEK